MLRVILVVFATAILVGIRAFASELFYDPLIEYFTTQYHHAGAPEYDFLGMLLHLSMRYWLNTLVSLFILWLIFTRKEIVQFSFFIYLIAFTVLAVLFIALLPTLEGEGYRALFYVRRFLIHPLLLLLLIPAFYFQKLSK